MELEDIKKLRPEERIRRLKELEKKRKEEIEKAEELIRSSEHELRVEEELRDIPIPQVKAVNIEQLFGAEERRVFKTKRFIPEETIEVAPTPTEEERERSLEETVSQEAPTAAEASGPVYGLTRERVEENLGELYNAIREEAREEMREMRERAAGGPWTEEDDRQLEYRMSQVERAAQSSQYAGEEARQRFEEVKTAVDQIRSYRRRTGV